MSNNALFFWSKKATSSLYYKSIIIQNKLNINIISVDNTKVRDLISNSKYPIKHIPSLLVITGNDFRLYSGENLKIWFDKFFETISLDNQNQNEPNYSELQPLNNQAPIKPVMNRQQLSENYRSVLSSPGIEFNGNTSLTLIPEPEHNDDSKFIMANRGIGKPPKKLSNDDDYQEEIESAETLRPSKLKNNSISAAELADQLKSQREELEQQLEENRPFD